MCTTLVGLITSTLDISTSWNGEIGKLKRLHIYTMQIDQLRLQSVATPDIQRISAELDDESASYSVQLSLMFSADADSKRREHAGLEFVNH